MPPISILTGQETRRRRLSSCCCVSCSQHHCHIAAYFSLRFSFFYYTHDYYHLFSFFLPDFIFLFFLFVISLSLHTRTHTHTRGKGWRISLREDMCVLPLPPLQRSFSPPPPPTHHAHHHRLSFHLPGLYFGLFLC